MPDRFNEARRRERKLARRGFGDALVLTLGASLLSFGLVYRRPVLWILGIAVHGVVIVRFVSMVRREAAHRAESGVDAARERAVAEWAAVAPAHGVERRFTIPGLGVRRVRITMLVATAFFLGIAAICMTPPATVDGAVGSALIAVVCALVAWRVGRVEVSADASRLVVRNFFASRSLTKADIASFELRWPLPSVIAIDAAGIVVKTRGGKELPLTATTVSAGVEGNPERVASMLAKLRGWLIAPR